MKARVIILVALLSVLSMGRAEAQRCLPKMQGIELRAGLNEADGYVLGAALSSYAKGGDKWVYGVEYLQTNHGYRSTTIPAAQFTAEGGYYYNRGEAEQQGRLCLWLRRHAGNGAVPRGLHRADGFAA